MAINAVRIQKLGYSQERLPVWHLLPPEQIDN